MSFRLLVQEEVVYEGEPIPVPRVGEGLRHEGEAMPVEAVTWDFVSGGNVSVTLVLGSRPYTF